MCLPLIVVGLAVAAAAASAAAAKQQADAQSKMASNNAKIASEQQADSLLRGEVETSRMGIQNAAEMGKQNASFAASGLSMGSDSAQAVLANNRGALAQNVENTRYNAAMAGWGYQAEAASQRAQAGMYNAAGNMALVAGGLNAGSSLLGGVKTGAYSSSNMSFSSWKATK